MDLAFSEDGCIALPFSEPCPYTWEGEIFHSSGSLKFYFKFLLAKFRLSMTLVSIVNILSNEKMNLLKIPQELLV
jgi:hypothetical protein